jgi:PAS domain S-box-containing protein
MSVGNSEKPDRALRANDSGVRPIVDASPVLACSLTAQLEVELVSQSLLDYFGKTLDELKNWASIGVVHPNDLEVVISQIRHSAETGESFDFENRCRRYDGVFRWLQARGLPLRNAQGHIERWYVLLIDIEDKRQAEDALRKTEHSLNSIINAIPELAWSTEPDGSVDFLNQRWLDYTGLTAEQSLGWKWATALHTDDIGGLTEYWKTIMATGVSGEYEARLRRFDGIYRWFLFRAVPVKDESGNVIKWYGQSIDIEERKRAEDTVRAQEQELRAAINAIPTPAWSTRPDGYVDFLNQRWLDYAGMTAEEAQGWGWGTSIHPDDRENLSEKWQLCLASGIGAEAEARHRRFDGVYRWFLVRANPLRDESGNIIKWYGINIDIEERKRAEDTVRENEQALRATINTIPTPAFSTLPDGYVDFLNQRWLDYAGMSAEQAQGWGWGTSIHPDDRDGLVQQWQLCLASGTEAEAEARYRRFDGVYRWCLVRANPLRDESGNVVKWYGISIDIEDRKRAEEELRAKERDLIRIINTIPTTAWSTRPDGYCEFLSNRWLDYAGFTYEEAVGWRWATAIHPDDAAGLQEVWLKALASGTPVNTEARMRRFDGVYRWFLFLAQPFRDESGTIVKWYGTNVDIEDRKKAGEALRESERTLNLIINTIPMLAWSTDPSGSVEFLNQRWLEFTGLSAEQASGFGWSVAIHSDDAKGLIDYWQAALDSGTEVDVEARMRRFDGQYRWFLFRASPLRDESGKIVKWYGTNVDIEDRKRADEELRRSEAFLAEGQRLSRTGTFAWRPDTTKVIWSEELYRIHEIAPGTPISTDLARIGVHPDDIETVNGAAARGVETGSDYEHTHRIVMPDGRIKFLHVMARATRDSEGRLEYIGAVQDVSQRMLSEEALTKSRSELAHITRVMSLGILTASIAHEVNQPLAGIITNAETCLQMLDDSPPDIEGARETALRSIRDGNRASDVIARLRSLFKRKDFIAEIIDLNEATREVIALSSGELRRSRVVLQMDLADDLPPVNGDRVQLQQVIINLVRNAMDAMREIDDRPRQLLIQTERDGAENVRLTVQDTGIGFAPETADRLFESFYSTKDDGMGIGLAISRSIIETHHGQIWATLNHGPGATFAFSIPCGSSGA